MFEPECDSEYNSREDEHISNNTWVVQQIYYDVNGSAPQALILWLCVTWAPYFTKNIYVKPEHKKQYHHDLYDQYEYGQVIVFYILQVTEIWAGSHMAGYIGHVQCALLLMAWLSINSAALYVHLWS